MMNALENDVCCLSLMLLKATENRLSVREARRKKSLKVDATNDDQTILVEDENENEKMEEKEKEGACSKREKDDEKRADVDVKVANDGEKLEHQTSFRFHDNNYCSELLVWAEAFCRSNWNLSGQSLVSLTPNPYVLQRRSTVITKFSNALEEHQISLSSDDKFVFAWHGTQSSSIVAICRDGFDVYKRQGQQYGTGQYFGTNCGISHGYCKGGHFMLVCLLLKGDWLTQHPGSSYVCNNPIPSYSTYSLPLLVVNFGTERPSPFKKSDLC